MKRILSIDIARGLVMFYYLIHWYVLRCGRPAKGSGLPLAGVYACGRLTVINGPDVS